jgi:hypothetical protein
VSRSNTWKKVGLGALLVAAIAAPEALHAVRAAPQPLPAAFSAAPAAAKPFAAVCKANEVADSRPDPAWVGASFAHDNCWAPAMPSSVNGAAASRAQIVAAMAAEKRYNALAAVYQKCVSDFVVARNAEANNNKKPVDEALNLIEDHRITTSDDNRKKVAALTRNAINDFNEFGSQCDD